MSARLIGRIAAEAWLIHEPALRTMLEIADRATPDPATLEAWKGERPPFGERLGAVAGLPLDRMPGAQMTTTGIRSGVAVLGVGGPIFRYANLFTSLSGAVSLAAFAHDLALARQAASVRAIVVTLDTPGGEATGIAEVARQVRQAAAEKPLVAYVDGSAASAGYWLAAAAGELVVSTTATVGCLGAMAMLTDRSEADARSGVRKFEFVSSQTPNKRPDPTTEAGRVRWQALVDRLADEFLADAAAFRGVTVDRLLSATDGGGLVMGSDAVAGGLADRVGDFESVLAELAGGGGRLAAAPRISNRQRGSTMPTGQTGAAGADNGAPAAVAGAESGAPAPSAAAVAPGAAAEAVTPRAEAQGAADVLGERARCSAILGAFLAAAPARHAWLARMAMAQGWTADQFSAALAEAQAEAPPAPPAATAPHAEAAAAAFRGALPAPVRTAPAAESSPDPNATDDASLRARWDADATIRAEYGGQFARFAAFQKASQAGRVRIFSRAQTPGGAAA